MCYYDGWDDGPPRGMVRCCHCKTIYNSHEEYLEQDICYKALEAEKEARKKVVTE